MTQLPPPSSVAFRIDVPSPLLIERYGALRCQRPRGIHDG
jgi:hypothetical protein